MRFNLTSLLLIVVCASIALAWIVDRNKGNAIAGKWRYPTSDIALIGYSTTLSVNPDGTFSKSQDYRTHSDVYSGTYARNENGTVTFNVTDVTYESPLLKMLDQDSEVTKLDRTFTFRYSITNDRHLLLELYQPQFYRDEPPRIGELEWENVYAAENGG